jgi:hypothetical protein
MLRKNIYRWHRVCSLIIALPVLLWATSGFLHPVMTNFRPAMATQALPVTAIDTHYVRQPLTTVLAQNHIDTIYSARLVHIDTSWFYQVRVDTAHVPVYFSARNGHVLRRGDWLYAQYLARVFLEGPEKKDSSLKDGAVTIADCCDAATFTVLGNDKGAEITSATLVTAFTPEYTNINCLLPVYRVDFKRADGIRIYVETAQDRFGAAVDNRRAAFTRFFTLVHTWGWIDCLGYGRIFVEMFFTALAFLTTLMGLYIFFISKSRKSKKMRFTHRITALVASLFTLMFTLSGCYHAFAKLGAHEKTVVAVQPAFLTSSLRDPVLPSGTVNIGLAQVQGKAYWQIYKQESHVKDLMKSMAAPVAAVTYAGVADGQVLQDGDQLYAAELAAAFSGQHSATKPVAVTHFTDEYNFTDKRLPVWKASYPGQRIYVETSTGVLTKIATDSELWEGYSFALFHKHHYMDWAGKSVRDASTMLGAGLQLIMVVIGLILYFTLRKK